MKASRRAMSDQNMRSQMKHPARKPHSRLLHSPVSLPVSRVPWAGAGVQQIGVQVIFCCRCPSLKKLPTTTTWALEKYETVLWTPTVAIESSFQQTSAQKWRIRTPNATNLFIVFFLVFVSTNRVAKTKLFTLLVIFV